jgi:hypothetical protein
MKGTSDASDDRKSARIYHPPNRGSLLTATTAATATDLAFHLTLSQNTVVNAHNYMHSYNDTNNIHAVALNAVQQNFNGLF